MTTAFRCDDEYRLMDRVPEAGDARARRFEMSTGKFSSWQQWATEELKELEHYADGWDGDEAPRPDKLMIGNAMGFVKWLEDNFDYLAPPIFSISPNSTVLFTWTDTGKTLDVEFKTGDLVKYFYKDRISGIRRPGALRHRRFDPFFLLLIEEFTEIEHHRQGQQTSR